MVDETETLLEFKDNARLLQEGEAWSSTTIVLELKEEILQSPPLPTTGSPPPTAHVSATGMLPFKKEATQLTEPEIHS